MTTFILNKQTISVELPAGIVVLDFLRDQQKLTGTKEGCREGDCGACTVLIGETGKTVGKSHDLQPQSAVQLKYNPVNSCLLPLGELAGKHLVTIEGLNSQQLSPIQQSFMAENAAQCGFCTPGFVISLTGYLLNCQQLNFDAAITAVDSNICRCTGYVAIKRAIRQILQELDKSWPATGDILDRINFLIKKNILPAYFAEIPIRLKSVQQASASQQLISESENSSSQMGDTPPVLVAGGTDLFVQNPDSLSQRKLRFISRSNLSKGIKIEGDFCQIGAGTTVAEIKNSKTLSARRPLAKVSQYFNQFASTAIRNRATLGGNLVNASPIGDLTIFFLALNSQICLSNSQNDGLPFSRIVPLPDFYQSYKNVDLQPDEIVDYLKFQVPKQNARFNFEKVSKRRHLDIASVNSAMLIQVDPADMIEEIHLSAGGVSAIPLYLTETVTFLTGKTLTAKNIKAALEIINSEISPITDIRGSAEYKRLLLRQLIISHFITLFPERFNLELLS